MKSIANQGTSSKNFKLVLITFLIFPFVYFLASQESTASYFLSLPRAENIKEFLRFYTSKPHIAGTDNDKDQALYTLNKFKEFGIEAWIDEYYPLINYPKRVNVSIHSFQSEEVKYLKLSEDVIEEDEDSKKYHNAVSPFHGFSFSGSAEGNLVFANYGTLDDFTLLSKTVNLAGKIALVRYGMNFRGLKVRAAEKFGLAGVLVYSDPQDDGFAKGKVYPEGPYRPESSVQRGSVHYMSSYPGDPLTPGIPALKDAKRIKVEEANLPKIPSLPISYQDAKLLFQSLRGHGKLVVNGSLGEYWSGPSTDTVSLINEQDYKIRPIWNVMGRINGTGNEKDQVVVLGNHRDAWVFGAVDPSSGSAALLELVRSFGELLKIGWKPKRTILFASWDGEEYGMLGSTEYVEDKIKYLKENCVSYINVDSASSGSQFKISGTPSLSGMIREVTKLVTDHKSGNSIYDEWEMADIDYIKTHNISARIQPHVQELGSGSDFVSFVDFAGVASINFDFVGPYGVYHSIYDSYHWMEKFGDPGFKYIATATKLWGLMALRLVDDVILPFNYTEYALEMDGYVEVLESKLNFTLNRVRRSITNAYWAGKVLELEAEVVKESKDKSLTEKFNRKLFLAEREFLSNGIKGREWYKHVVYAPGLWSGYGAATFPQLNEAIDNYLKGGNKKDVYEAQLEIADRIEQVVNKLLL